MKTTEILADTRGGGRCRGCDAALIWAEVAKSGKRMPFDPPLVALRTRHDDAQRVVEEVDLAASHFGTCPQAARFGRR